MKGFSLLESLILLAIISTMGATATPALSRWSAHRAVSEETEFTRLALEEAFLTALTYNRTVVAHVTGEGFRVSFEGGEPLFSHSSRKGVSITLKSPELQHL